MKSTNKVIKGHVQTAQRCPLCDMLHPIHVQGLVYSDPVKMNGYSLTPDRGYSFCNCRNIFFTDWKNIDQSMYGYDYHEKYNPEKDNGLYKIATDRANRYLDMFGDGAHRTFLEIGAANNYTLDAAKARGFNTVGVDINPHSFIKDGHQFIPGDVESFDTLFRLPPCDVIWTSHVFEHFHSPLTVAENLLGLLHPGGYLFVAMPDPWFIPWANPKNWIGWMIREHHILWDMDSFIDAMEEVGFKIEFSKRNVEQFMCSGDYSLVFRKPLI